MWIIEPIEANNTGSGKMKKVIFDDVEVGIVKDNKEARKLLQSLSNFRIQKFATDSWDDDSVSGFERGGNERVFRIVQA